MLSHDALKHCDRLTWSSRRAGAARLATRPRPTRCARAAVHCLNPAGHLGAAFRGQSRSTAPLRRPPPPHLPVLVLCTQGGYVVLTSRRLIWMDGLATLPAGAAGRSCWLPIHRCVMPCRASCSCSCCLLSTALVPPCSVLSVHKKSKLAFTGSKVRLMLDVASNFEGRPVLGKLTAIARRPRGPCRLTAGRPGVH